MNANLIELLKELNMPQEAIDAGQAQLDLRQDLSVPSEDLARRMPRLKWEHSPENLDEMVHQVYPCDDCGIFHENWVGHGFLVEDGEFHVVHWDADLCGNWDRFDSEEVTSLQELEEATSVNWDQIQAGFDSYFKEVSETGNDYLGQLPCRPTEKQTWMVYFSNYAERVQVMSTQRVDIEGEDFQRGEDMPQKVLDYCLADKDHLVDPTAGKDVYELLGVAGNEGSTAGVVGADTEYIQDGNLALKICLDMPRDPETLQAETKDHALQILKRQVRA